MPDLPLLATGIDEAGYGPTLGPLAIVRVSAQHAPGADPLAPLVAAGAVDSKRLHRGDDLAPLERVALAGITWLTGFQPDTAADVFALLGETADSRAACPWMAEAAGLRLPLAAAGLPAWDLPGLEPAGLAGALVQPAAYNAWMRSGAGNKADLELHHVGRLLAAIHDPGRDQDTVVDRLGGRKFYAPPLERTWPGRAIAIEQEDDRASVYRVDRHRIAFRVGGESASALTALASCIAKYARELHMHLLNRWWCGRLRWIRPTAGYPEDAKRWLHQIGTGHVNAWGDALVRGWTGQTMIDDHG